MATSIEEECAAFLEKVRRTIYIDNLAPYVTEAVMKAAFNQFGNARSVQFIPNYFGPKNMPQAALLEMENPLQAWGIINQMENYPLMISGMPRPARARTAKLGMFDDHPRKPGRTIVCRWLEPEEPDFQVAKKIRDLVRRHAAEASVALVQQLAEEEKFADQQNDTFKEQFQITTKFQTIADAARSDSLTQTLTEKKVEQTSIVEQKGATTAMVPQVQPSNILNVFLLPAEPKKRRKLFA